MTTSVLHLNISEINTSLQFRQLDNETVTDYADALVRKEELPDVNVAFDKELGTYYMTDGFHRLEAHKRNKAEMITATVNEMPKQDALWLALGANKQNGRRLTNEDKRAAVATALKEFPNATPRAIADHVGCSIPFILQCKAVMLPPSPLLDAEIADEPDEDDEQNETDEKPKRKVTEDDEFIQATQEEIKPTPDMTSEQDAIQALENAIFALPSTLTIEIRNDNSLVILSIETGQTLRLIPLQRGTDWENFPIKPFFKFAKADWETLENGGIATVGDLAKLVKRDKTLPKFGNKKIENLEKQFEEFWENHPELCNSTPNNEKENAA